MTSITPNNEKEIHIVGLQKHSQPSTDIHLDLQKLSSKHRTEYFEVKPILDSLGIQLVQDNISDKPDFRFTYEDKEIGLETTRCYPPDALIHKNNKEQNKYEIGYKSVRQILNKYERYKAERGEWVSLFITFQLGLGYTLRDSTLTKQEIETIEKDVIAEIETRLRRGHYSKPETSTKQETELDCMNYKYTQSIIWDEPQEGKVILGLGGIAQPERTIEIEQLRKAIFDKESKLSEYRQLVKNKDIDEYWLSINLPISSERFPFNLESFEIQSGYSRIYVTQFVYARRIK